MSFFKRIFLLQNQQGPASPAVHTRQCNQTMAHCRRDGSELWLSASVRTAAIFCVATAFFRGLVPGQPSRDSVWGREPSAAGQEHIVRFVWIFLFVVGLRACSSLWPSSASLCARHSVKSGGGRARTSGKSSYRASKRSVYESSPL